MPEHPPRDRFLTAFVIGAFIFAVVASAVCSWYWHHLRVQRSDWRVADGVVDNINWRTPGKPRRSPTFSASFDIDGRRYHTAHHPEPPGWDFPELLDIVPVYYDPENPRQNELRSDVEDATWWTVPFVWVAIGLVVWLLWRRRRSRERGLR